MSDKTRLVVAGPIMGFLVAVAFGVGLISMAAYDSVNPFGAQPAAAIAPSEVLEVELGDLFLKPETFEADAGSVTFNIHNGGKVAHNFAILGAASSDMIAPGESDSITADLKPGTYEILCQVAGHAEGGMKGTLVVAGAGAEQASGGGHAGHMSAQKMAKHDAAVTASFPAKTKGVGGTDLEPKVRGGVKVFELTADEMKWETEPGKFVEAWGYNGMVPGPTIRANLGDRVRIILHNKLAEPTTIHHHGMTVPANMDGVPVISQAAVMPGDSFTYEFTVKDTGSHMYHSHFDASKQVPMGLLGAFIVPDPRDPRVEVDQTIVLNDGPLGFTLNGKGFPATAPIVAKKGDTVRMRYMNEGLQIHQCTCTRCRSESSPRTATC